MKTNHQHARCARVAVTWLAALGLLGQVESARAGTITFSTIALTGTDGALGPGQGPGVNFTGIGGAVASINNSGQVILRGQSTAAGNPFGVWVHSGGANTNVALSGNPQPGGGTYPNTGFNSPMINNAGQTAWRSGTTSLFSNIGGGPGLVMKPGDVALGTGGATYISLGTPSPYFNAAGQTGYVANLASGTGSPPVVLSGSTANSTGLWIGPPGAANLALRQNDLATSLDPGGGIRVGSFSASGVAVNDAGRYAALTNLQGNVVAGTTSGNDQALLSNRGGSLEVIARRGDQAHGAPAGEFYRAITFGGINGAGSVAYSASLRDAAGATVTSGALFSDTSGTLTMHARGGNPMPAINGASGTEFNGVNWGAFFGATVINSAGTIAFTDSGMAGTGITVGQNDAGIFEMDASGQFSKVMRLGDTAPVGLAGDGSPIRFGGIQGGLAMNDAGQVAFSTLLTGFGVGGAFGNNSALFATDPDGSILTIARKGSLFEVAPGDFRTVAALGGVLAGGGEDGRPRMFNDLGQLVFSLDFSDGTSGVFVANVPEPATAGIMLIGMLVLARRMRRMNRNFDSGGKS